MLAESVHCFVQRRFDLRADFGDILRLDGIDSGMPKDIVIQGRPFSNEELCDRQLF